MAVLLALWRLVGVRGPRLGGAPRILELSCDRSGAGRRPRLGRWLGWTRGDDLVGGQGEELLERLRGRDLLEEAHGLVEAAGGEARLAERAAERGHLLAEDAAEALGGEGLAAVERRAVA